MPEKKKMFKELHERWKDMDLPDEQKDVLNSIEGDIKGLKQEKYFMNIIAKLRKDLNNANLWFRLGASLSELKKYDFALAALNITEKVQPKTRHLPGIKGYVLTKLGRTDEAKKSLVKAITQTGPIKGYDTVDAVIEGIRSGTLGTKAFTVPAVAKPEPEKIIEDLDKEIEGLLEEAPKAPPTKTELESELEALSDELDKILGVEEEEVIEVYKCPECGAEFSAEAEICPKCGSEFAELEELPETMKLEEVEETYECPDCGKEVPSDALSCPYCKAKFEEEEGEVFSCPACGEDVDEKATVCPSCGAQFITEMEELEAGLEELLIEEEIPAPTPPKPRKTEPPLRPQPEEIEMGLKPALGLTNGLTPAERKARAKIGLTTGVTNGFTNGLTNGLRALRVGITNGLTNGNGITNGLGQRPGVFEPKRSKLKLVVVPIVVLFLVFSPYLLLTTSEPPAGIVIDGKFGDWTEVAGTSDTSEAPEFNHNVDIRDYRLEARDVELSLYLEVAGNMLEGEPGGNKHVDTVHIFIDTDRDPKTGYFITGIGADFMVEVYGWDGEVMRKKLYNYPADEHDWGHWKPVAGDVRTAVSGSAMEIKMMYNSLYLGKNDDIEVLFYTQSWNGFEDFSDTIISTKKGVLEVSQRGIAEGVITEASKRILELNVKAHHADITITEIKFTRLGVGSDGDISGIRLMQGGNLIQPGTLANGIVEVRFNYQVNQGTEATLEVEVEMGNPIPGRSLGFRIENNHDVTVNQGIVHLKREKPAQGRYEIGYLMEVPNNVTIDGAFADWEGKTVRNDTDSDVNRADLDIVRYGASTMDNGPAFFLNVKDKMLGGVEVPYKNDAFVTEAVGREGPVSPGQPELPEEPKTGEDVVYVFLDTIPGPGYLGGGVPITADYL
ncbi:MAG: zinc ribbon domain-containing protein, partial [Thermoplasmata archaeon]